MGNGDCSHSWLDELLCEYVDGTMDPTVRVAFEECLSTDPVLRRQAECLRSTRTLLCRHGCQVRAPQGLQDRVRRRLAREMVHPPPPFFPQATLRLGMFVAAGSVLAIMVMIGMLVGAVWLAPQPVADGAASPALRQQALGGLQPATMTTPVQGYTPLQAPTFAGQPAATPLRLTRPAARMPEVFLPGHLQHAGLQRTGVKP